MTTRRRQIQNLLASFDESSEAFKPADPMRGFDFRAVPSKLSKLP